MSGKPVVAVTGCGGFLASTLVRILLEQGYSVKGTLRNPSDPKKTEHLKAYPGAAERLSLHKADLLDGPDAFASIFVDCEIVFHTACPYVIVDRAGALGEEFFVKNARDGTINILEACLRSNSVKRVVMTSSTAAVLRRLVPAGHQYSEADWNDENELRTRGLVYAIGKTLQERAAWVWMAEHGRGDPTGVVGTLPTQAGTTKAGCTQAQFDLVCMNPSLIGGPMEQQELNASSESAWQFASGQKSKIPNVAMPWVDVRDVASAHLRAAETPAASGRYLLIGCWPTSAQICDQLRAILPSAPIPTELDLPVAAEGQPAPVPVGPGLFTAARAETELGIKFKGLDQIMEATVQSLIKHGYLKA